MSSRWWQRERSKADFLRPQTRAPSVYSTNSGRGLRRLSPKCYLQRGPGPPLETITEIRRRSVRRADWRVNRFRGVHSSKECKGRRPAYDWARRAGSWRRYSFTGQGDRRHKGLGGEVRLVPAPAKHVRRWRRGLAQSLASRTLGPKGRK